MTALFLRDNERLFCHKIKEVVIMGGVKEPVHDSWLEPDAAANNQFDPESAAFLYKRCQELNIPLVILGRSAAYTCPVPRRIYDDLASTGHTSTLLASISFESVCTQALRSVVA